MIEIKGITHVYQAEKISYEALKDVSLFIDKGEFTALSGPSGSGKTTLLNLIGGLDIPSQGKIFIEGNEVIHKDPKTLAALRLNSIGFIFQSFNLIPVLSVFENVEYPLLLTRKKETERKAEVDSVLKKVGLEKFSKHRPNQLSGGQKQRVAIARALVNRPRIILADEPTANLDSVTSSEVLSLMQKLNEEEKITFVFSSHDPMIINLSKRVVKIKDGRILN